LGGARLVITITITIISIIINKSIILISMVHDNFED